jgi:exonuclease SbcD
LHLPGTLEETELSKTYPIHAPFRALEALVDTANYHKVDLLLFVGDLFDTYRPNEQVVSFVLEQFERLEARAILIPGNHDCLGSNETYYQPAWKEAGQSPYVITDTEGELFKVPDLPVVIWGKGMIEHTPEYQPLEGLPPKTNGNWHVAMGHGFFYPEGESGFRASPIHARQIRDSGWDYIALGHLHRQVEVSQGPVKAAYSGSPVISWNPEAQALLVTMDPREEDPVTLQKLTLFFE